MNDTLLKDGGFGLPASRRRGSNHAEAVKAFKDIYEIQKFIDSFLDKHEAEWRLRGFETPMRLRYAFSEAVMNAWNHGNKRDPNKKITIRCRYGRSCKLEIIDEGEGFDIGSVPDPRLGENVYGVMGRGILLIRRFAASVKWKDKGKRLVMTFFRKCGEPPLFTLQSPGDSGRP